MVPGDSGIRAFLAVQLPEVVRESLMEAARGWLKLLPEVRWVAAENLHLTIKFLGRTEPEVLAKIGPALGPALRERPPFALDLAGVGVFPDPRRARVLFVKVDRGAAETAALMTAADRLLAGVGIAPEERPARPHLTVGRVKVPGRARGVPEWLRAAADFKSASFEVEEVALMSSDLGPGGPIYRNVETYRLGNMQTG